MGTVDACSVSDRDRYLGQLVMCEVKIGLVAIALGYNLSFGVLSSS